MSDVDDILAMMRRGEKASALLLLRDLDVDELDHQKEILLFLLLEGAGETALARDVATKKIAAANDPFEKSRWVLRRGLLYLVEENTMAAAKDFTDVLRINASDDHNDQARTSLSRALQKS